MKSSQYSTTQFERDLIKGGEHDDHGIALQHGVQGVPGTLSCPIRLRYRPCSFIRLGAFFNFEISPILVVHSEGRQSFAHFLTSTCAIVGGVLTVASLLDGVLFAAGHSLKKRGANVNGKMM